MKIIDIQTLNSNISEMQHTIHQIQKQLHPVSQAVQQIASLDDALKGKGASAIRSFYEDVHQPFLAFMDNFLTSYDQMLNQIKDTVHSFEPATDGFVRQSFLEQDLEEGLKQLENVTQGLTDNVNRELTKIQDIISLPHLDDMDLLTSIHQAKNKKNEMIEQLYALDSSQLRALEPMMHELSMMTNYLSEMQETFHADKGAVTTYDPTTLDKLTYYQEVVEANSTKTE
ncbi:MULTISPECIES: LXG domain-containing protein [Virgibacillus]|uniref:LXG domain-containing protein n=1 Tax=Virgibacillus kapii TaxID=1638645 RepID=A0ABQ2DV26_9BACI|nr:MULTISPECIES: LXG domain-containing protein [Virgibacillus]EQB39024.1 hypothetical protein M948_01350 [Virgibacillus sp. CM-4]MYL43384.1 hypothetical protein [Virgibacillus massiliensis]GGJ68388.1 hypothetical protein GCM10007111_32680 [Virgibacillus kapii]